MINRVLNGTPIVKKFIQHLHKNLKLYIAKDLEENKIILYLSQTCKLIKLQHLAMSTIIYQ
jgi:hypothetical protein